MINRYRKLISRHPFLLTWFSFDGRVNRRQYLFRSLALGAVWLLTIAIAWYGTNALFNMKLDILGGIYSDSRIYSGGTIGGYCR